MPAQALYAQTCYEPAPSYAAVSLDCQGTSHDALNSSLLFSPHLLHLYTIMHH